MTKIIMNKEKDSKKECVAKIANCPYCYQQYYPKDIKDLYREWEERILSPKWEEVEMIWKNPKKSAIEKKMETSLAGIKFLLI